MQVGLGKPRTSYRTDQTGDTADGLCPTPFRACVYRGQIGGIEPVSHSLERVLTIMSFSSGLRAPAVVGSLLAVQLTLSASLRGAVAQERPTLTAAPATTVTVDGRLAEPAWAEAEAATDFLQFEPSEGAPASQRTEVKVLYGPGSLYVGAVLHDSEPAEIERSLGRRDEFNRADWFVVSIDAYLDRRTAYAFGVNAAGVQFDAVQDGGGGGGPGPGGGGGGPTPDGMDESWDAIWSSAVEMTPEGWVVEMSIPYSMLRFRRAPSQTWGIQFSRHLPRAGERSEWPLVRRVERSNQVAQFADLTGISGIEPRRNLQISPYSVARLEGRESDSEPGARSGNGEVDIGGDLKLGIGPNVTLDATINPDFGQVESDPAVMNLTAFETVFDERRPFFVEGSSIYQFESGPGSLLYTRRIGAESPIIGAAKLSGRTAHGLSFGVLGATTGEDWEPNRHFGVARATQQFQGNSTAGGIVTLYEGPALEGRGRSVSAGADWDLRFLDDRYGIEGFAASTNRWWTAGEEEAEQGFAGKVWGVKRQGSWQGFAGAEVFSDEFNPNDVGQLRENNAYVLISSIEHEINGNRPFGPFQRASAELFGVQRFAYTDRLNQGLELELSSRGMLRSFQAVELAASFESPFGGYDLYETRGLGPWARPASVQIQAEISTDERRSWVVEPEVGLTFVEGGGRGYATGLRGNWRVSDRISLEGNLEGEWEDDVPAWSSNETFLLDGSGEWMIGRESGEPATDPADFVAFDDRGLLQPILQGMTPTGTGQYFVPVFGNRDTRAVDLTLRGGYTFTPDLSLQLYSQFFVAGGRYGEMGILRNRDEIAPFDAFPKRDDFAFSSLQSNAVLRWEYRPGSVLYLVWTHGRQVDDELNPLAPWGPSPYDRSFRSRIGDTFDIVPHDVLLVKLSYTFLN